MKLKFPPRTSAILVVLLLALLVLCSSHSSRSYAMESFDSNTDITVYMPKMYDRYKERHDKVMKLATIDDGEDWLGWNTTQLYTPMFLIFEKNGKAKEVKTAVSRVKNMCTRAGAEAASVTIHRIDYLGDDRSIAYRKRQNFITVRFTSSIGNGEALFFVRGDQTADTGALLNVAVNHRAFTDSPPYLIVKDKTPPFPTQNHLPKTPAQTVFQTNTPIYTLPVPVTPDPRVTYDANGLAHIDSGTLTFMKYQPEINIGSYVIRYGLYVSQGDYRLLNSLCASVLFTYKGREYTIRIMSNSRVINGAQPIMFYDGNRKLSEDEITSLSIPTDTPLALTNIHAGHSRVNKDDNGKPYKISAVSMYMTVRRWVSKPGKYSDGYLDVSVKTAGDYQLLLDTFGEGKLLMCSIPVNGNTTLFYGDKYDRFQFSFDASKPARNGFRDVEMKYVFGGGPGDKTADGGAQDGRNSMSILNIQDKETILFEVQSRYD